jgi:hypothetical protein
VKFFSEVLSSKRFASRLFEADDTMHITALPTTALPAWCKLNNVSFHDVSIKELGSSGNGIVTDRTLSSEQETFDIPALMMIANELILCRGFIEEHARVDSHFRELLTLAGGKVSLW